MESDLGVGDGLPEIYGDMLHGSILDHVRACRVLIEEEQRKPNPDNALIETLCNSVRFAREHCSNVGKAELIKKVRALESWQTSTIHVLAEWNDVRQLVGSGIFKVNVAKSVPKEVARILEEQRREIAELDGLRAEVARLATELAGEHEAAVRMAQHAYRKHEGTP